MPIAGTSIALNTTEGQDKITVTEKVTSPYFSTGVTELLGARITTQSLAADNRIYYQGISDVSSSTTPEFHVAYGNNNGKGGNSDSDNVKSPTEVIYKQWASLLLPPTEVTGGFFISQNKSLASAPSNAANSGIDNDIYVLVGRRANMKDRLNKKNWSIVLSGSGGSHVNLAHNILHLTDDSVNDTAVASPVGDRYNIVSGSDGTVQAEATDRTIGFYYPDIGTMIFSATELSASIPGEASATNTAVVSFNSASNRGFGAPSLEDNNYENALRFINCLNTTDGTTGKLKFRDEEDQVSAQYFCRIKAGDMNFSNNPTFVSGSLNELRHTTMKGNPSTFLTAVQLYNNNGEMVAVGNLSTPLKKNFSSEATIKVKLTY